MLSDEEKKAIEGLFHLAHINTYLDLEKGDVVKISRHLIDQWRDKTEILLNLIKKQSKEIEELKREKETNQQMIHLAETQILGYGQGYKDGLNKEITATEIVARERENQIIYEEIKHKINMEWVLKIKAKIEEVDYKMIAHQDVREAVKQALQSLLEKE